MARMPISASSSQIASVASEFSTARSVTEPAAKIYERALTLAAMGLFEEAITLLRVVTARAADHAPAWRKLAELLRLAGQDEEADAADTLAHGKRAEWPAAVEPRAPREIEDAESSLRELMGKIAIPPEQAKTLRDHLRHHETDVTAMRLLARLEWGCDDMVTACALFERALALAPAYESARADYAQLLKALGEHARAVAETGRLVSHAPTNITYRTLHADALYAVGDLESAIPAMEQLIREQPAHVRFRSVYAQALHFAGRRQDSAREFRACLDLQPGTGEAYWGLAELRGKFLTAKDIADMRLHLRSAGGDKPGDMLIQYALGHALEQAGEFAESFAAYEAGAALAREIAADRGRPSDPVEDANRIQRYLSVYSSVTLRKHAAQRSLSTDTTPIFIVGMPRAGSTLVEQILASHSLVEGTTELPLIANITQDLALSRRIETPNAYPECLRDLTHSQLSELGARYLEEAKAYRKTGRPYFTDKRPWNWLEVGLIHLILPHAKIVDIRREPMAACFAMFKQTLANDAAFSYDFDHLARYYTQYIGVMDHWRSVLPGRVHFLQYERLVEDTEVEIRRLLDYCGLPFEENCLRFWETDRAVSTPSAEQVRRPIFRDALQQWRKFEPWLGPLKTGLGQPVRG
jgi:predicted Zn-dependent protease